MGETLTAEPPQSKSSLKAPYLPVLLTENWRATKQFLNKKEYYFSEIIIIIKSKSSVQSNKGSVRSWLEFIRCGRPHFDSLPILWAESTLNITPQCLQSLTRPRPRQAAAENRMHASSWHFKQRNLPFSHYLWFSFSQFASPTTTPTFFHFYFYLLLVFLIYT